MGCWPCLPPRFEVGNNATANAHAHATTNGHAHAHADADAEADAHAHAHAHAHATPHAHAHATPHAHAHAQGSCQPDVPRACHSLRRESGGGVASAFGFIVALASAMAWGGFDATRKRLVAGVDPISAAAWVSLAQGPLFLAWGAASGSLSLSTSYALVGSAVLVLQVVASVLLFRALAIAALSTVIPFLSLTPVFASLFGVAFLDERPSALQWVGIVTVVLAAVGMHARKTKPGRGTVGRGTVYAMGVALIWSFTSNLDKLALEHASLPVHAAVQSGGVGVVLLAWLLARGVLQPVPRKVMPVFATSVVMGTAALALQLWAIQLVFVGLVETIKRAAGLVSAAVLGRFMFGESITLRFVLGIVGVIVGTALLVLGGNI